METPGRSQGTRILLLPADANRKYRDFKQVPLADQGVPTVTGWVSRLVPDKSHSHAEQANGPSPTAPAQVLHSQLHKQEGETAKKHPV